MHLGFAYRPQRVETQAVVDQRLLRAPLRDALLLLQIGIGVLNEASLTVAGRLRTEAAVAVQHRQQRLADTGGVRCLHQLVQHRIISVGLAVRIVMQIVKFRHRL